MWLRSDDWFDLVADLFNQSRFAGFDIQSQEWFSVRRANVEAPIVSRERVAIGEIFRAFLAEAILDRGDRFLRILNFVVQRARHVVALGVGCNRYGTRLSRACRWFVHERNGYPASVSV